MMDYFFENFLGVLILCGITFIVGGFFLLKFPHKEINYFYGYRTKNSMKSHEHWDFAQKKSSLEMIKIGFLMMLTSPFPFLINLDEQQNIIFGLVFLFLYCIILFIRVEKSIKKKFKMSFS